MSTTIAIQQVQAINSAMQAEWHKDTGTAFNPEEFWGRAFVLSLGVIDHSMRNAVSVAAYNLGSTACRQYDLSSTLEEIERSGRHYQKICLQCLSA